MIAGRIGFWFSATLVAATLTATPLAPAQTVAQGSTRPWAGNTVIPQSRAYCTGAHEALGIEKVDAKIDIVEQVATTTLDVHLVNATGRRIEAELLVPVPEGAAVRGFAFDGASPEASAALLPADDARRLYERIVADVRDPALLEFVGLNLVRSSVFPVEAGGRRRVRLTYEQVLAADGDRIDYALPRSESLGQQIPWSIDMQIRARRPLCTAYSPSHPVRTQRNADGCYLVNLAPGASTEPGSFRLSYLLGGDLSASLLAYPDSDGKGGYFLLLAGVPARSGGGDDASMKREMTIVLDRSGSMRGGKIEQAKEAARQIIGALDEGETFNLLVYSDSVISFAPVPVAKSEEAVKKACEFLDGIPAVGGTNIHDALLESLRQPAAPGRLPLVLFLTDGLATVGQTTESAIRDVVVKANPHQRRVFTFGVGYDVNAPLLQKIAADTRATSTFVQPNEDVEIKVAEVYRRLQGPVLTDAVLTTSTASGISGPVVVDLIPDRLPDLFDGDQLVLLGRYLGDEPLRFRLSGQHFGKPRTFDFTFALDKATTKNSFVPRLWATRRVAQLADAIRQLGGDPGAVATLKQNPRTRELVDEIVRLSTEFGVLTEYTAFLAEEGTDLSKRDALHASAAQVLQERAAGVRSGISAVNQAENYNAQVMQSCSNYSNRFWDASMNRVEIAAVQQVNDRAFFQRGGTWVDSRIAQRVTGAEPKRVVTFGSPEYFSLLAKLTAQNRQGCASLKGDILLEVDGEAVLIQAPRTTESGAAQSGPALAPSDGC
ncbi:MAG: hypothetical protein FLDDKLPJ_00642 [Phycisphaerae bacterium]|nr:hypothetical protein [Phycisphaerae bacterium]